MKHAQFYSDTEYRYNVEIEVFCIVCIKLYMNY